MSFYETLTYIILMSLICRCAGGSSESQSREIFRANMVDFRRRDRAKPLSFKDLKLNDFWTLRLTPHRN